MKLYRNQKMHIKTQSTIKNSKHYLDLIENEKKFKISVITVCLNSERTIERCIKSIINQKYDKSRIEHIIIDGKSRDNTVKIIKKYKTKLHIGKVKTKVYHAMNKGIRKAKGDIIEFLMLMIFITKIHLKLSINTSLIKK